MKLKGFLAFTIVLVSSLTLFSCKKDNKDIVKYSINFSEDNTNQYGHLLLDSSSDKFNKVFSVGDIINVKFNDYSFDAPYVNSFGDVDIFKQEILVYKGNLTMTENMSNFIQKYGIASDKSSEDNHIWIKDKVNFTFKMKEKGGYLDELNVRSLVYSTKRSDYPNLTDKEYANYREVTKGNIKSDRLYRSASPIDPEYNRSSFVDNILKTSGITHIINLSDDEENAIKLVNEAKERGENPYYDKVTTIELKIGVDLTSEPSFKLYQTYNFQSESSVEKLKRGFKFIAENKGKYLVHCVEGKDRTGYVIALLEILCGASYEEVIEDYMVTYYNYYGITKDDSRYNIITKFLTDELRSMFGFDELTKDNYYEGAINYLKNKLKLTEEEIKAVKANLCNE